MPSSQENPKLSDPSIDKKDILIAHYQEKIENLELQIRQLQGLVDPRLNSEQVASIIKHHLVEYNNSVAHSLIAVIEGTVIGLESGTDKDILLDNLRLTLDILNIKPTK